MNRSLRKRSSYLLISTLFIASLAIASGWFLILTPAHRQLTLPPDSTISSQNPSSDSAYQKLVYTMTMLFNQQRYEECLVVLKQARELKPDAVFIQERIIRVEGLIAQQKKTREEYSRLISMADEYFTKKDYLNAKASYQLALETKPNDTYAKERLKQTMELLRSNKAQNILYDVTLAGADKLFAAGDYEKAKVQYENAGNILPEEIYPKEKINAIIKILVDQQVRDELYQQAIAAGDDFYSTKSYQRALLEYQKALLQKPDESYPKTRIDELTRILADLAALEQAYKEAIAQADQLFDETRYADARNGYGEALELKPHEMYPADKIKEIDGILDRIAKEDADFDHFVNLADSFYMERNFIRARQNYQFSLRIKPNESYPKAMLAKTAEGVGAQEADAMAMEQAYQAAIARADQLFEEEMLADSKAEYSNALAYKADDEYARHQITEIDERLAAAAARQKEVDAQYIRILENADRLFSDNLYPQAKEQYQKAIQLKPGEAYPVGKLAEVDEILAHLEEQKEIDTKYRALIVEANKLFTARSYEPARAEYVKALEVKPSEPLPSERVHEIDSILTILANREAMELRYAGLVAAADNALEEKHYQAALQGYQEAIGLKPKEAYPAGKIREINEILAGIAYEEKREADYLTAIKAGDSLLEGTAYKPAKEAYESALALKPGEAYPASKVEEIDALLAERARLQTLNQQYDEAIATADQLFTSSAWTKARESYQQALALKPEAIYPAEKMEAIDEKLAEIEREQALNQQYREVMASAEKFFSATKYDSARDTFIYAQTIKPAEALPDRRIAQIDSILAAIANQQALDEKYAGLIASADKLLLAKEYQASREGYAQALELKPGEGYPASKRDEIDAILAEIARKETLELQYSQAIKRGDSLFTATLLTSAKEAFETASGLKPEESYPKTKLAEIGLALAEIARQQAMDKQYMEEIETGDRLFAEKAWEPAIAAYKRGQEVKPSEEYPAQQIGKIDSIRLEIARQQKIDEQYQVLILHADQLFGQRLLDSARAAFSRAGELRPEKSYWQEQIAQIDHILAEQKRLNEEYQAAITHADALLAGQQYEEAREGYQNAALIKSTESYPREKIKEINQILAEIQGRRQTFDKLVANGDQFFSRKEYYKAKENFDQALELFPDESYPKERLHLSDVRIDSIFRANKADFDKAVGEGDSFFNTFEYDRAIDAYTRAITFLPNEDYPRQMIAKIRKTISENAIADVLNTPVVIKAGEEQRFPFEPVNVASRRNNFIYLKVRNLTQNSFNILMRYGKGDQTSGGLAIRNISADGEVNERLISVKDQDPWYREDNNWISIYPQGGDVEVSFIQVSRAIN
ncbi:MAG: hypothetical protein JXA23_09910 [Bacteroidales bacterium]|nr:hypothetical protein [Bacteroidales bacterium]